MCVALAFLAGAAHLPLKAVTTNAVDIAALIAAVDAGHSETNGWALSGLSKYAKGADYASNPACVKFDTKGDWLESNDFDARIVGIGFALRCSATDTASRFLYVRDLAGAKIGVVTNCSRANRCESQFLSFGQDADFSQFRIVLDGSGNTGVWGIGEMFVVTADPVFAPTGIAVVRTNANYFVLGWVNGANTVSNRVDVYRVDRGAGETVLLETGFDNFDAIGKENPVPSVDKLSGIDPALSGVNIYAPTNTSGICQIGTGKALGALRYDGISDYSNMVLRLRAKRYPGDNAETMIVSVDSSGATNQVETITLGEDYTDYEINLSSNQPRLCAVDRILHEQVEAPCSYRQHVDRKEVLRPGDVCRYARCSRRGGFGNLPSAVWPHAEGGVSFFGARDKRRRDPVRRGNG